MFTKNNLFEIFNLYTTLKIPELYLSFKNLTDAYAFLRAANVEISQMPHLEHGRVLLISGAADIQKAFEAFERASYLSVEMVADCLDALQNQLSFTLSSKLLPSSRLVPKPSGMTISLQDHQSVAIAAAKEGNTRLIQILLGNLVTAEDQDNFKTARINLDVGRDKEFCAEFEYHTLDAQLESLDHFLSLPEADQDREQLAATFERCIREHKAIIVGAKFAYSDYKPYVIYQQLDSDESFESWLNTIFDKHIASGVFVTPDSTTDLKMLKESLQDQLTAAEGLANKLVSGRQQVAHEYAKAEKRIRDKEIYHLQLIETFLADQSFLPSLYHYQDEEEKHHLIRLLQAVKIPVNTIDESGNTLLHHALNRMHLGLANLLLQQGVDDALQNHLGQTAAEYAGINPELLAKLKANPTQMLTVQSKFLAKAEEIFERYEKTLSAKEKDLQSWFWRLFEDKEIVVERRQSKTAYEETLVIAKATGNQGLLAQAIEIGSPKSKTKRGLRGRSRLHDELMQLVQNFRQNPEEWGLTSVDKTVVFLVNENNEQARIIIQQQQTIDTLQQQKDSLEQEKSDLVQRNSVLEHRNGALKEEKLDLTTRLSTSYAENKGLKEIIAEKNQESLKRDKDTAEQKAEIQALKAMMKTILASQGHTSGTGLTPPDSPPPGDSSSSDSRFSGTDFFAFSPDSKPGGPS